MNIRKSMRGMFRNRLRTTLTVSGIAVGVMAVVIVSSIGELGKTAISAELSGMGLDSLVVSAQEGGRSVLADEDLTLIRNVKNVNNAMPLINTVTEGRLKNEAFTCMAWGVNEDADNVIDLNVLHGRLLNKGDIAQGSLVCVIDETIALSIYKRSNITGKTLTVALGGASYDFEIIGVVKNGVNTLQNMMGGFLPDFVYIPYTVMQEALNTSRIDQITVRVNESDGDSEAIAASIKNILSIEKKNASVSVENLQKQKDKMNNVMGIASNALSAVAGISLIVSGLSIMTVMLTSVSERTREIGIKKSIGAAKSSIMLEFLLESALLTFTGAVMGFALGTAVSAAIYAAMGFPAQINATLFFALIFVSGFIGVIFGVYPAYKAASLNPVEALRVNH
ncbi:MAG: ABC transporter permease [Oscillospiraceae bacterium]|nr:ABC transporter permease [Oscillospiraceae bacterium]